MLTTSEPPTRRPPASWARGPRLLLLLAFVAVLAHVPALTNRPFNSDEAYLATQAEVLGRGGHLYVDTVDRKPPVVPYLFAATFELSGSEDLLLVRMLAVLASVLTAWLLVTEARRRFGSDRAGLIGGLLFLGASGAFYARDFQTANFEVFMLPAIVAAIVLAARRRPLTSGLALGVATLVKQTALTTLLPLVWIVWTGRSTGRGRARGLALLGVGTVAPVVLAALVFGPHDFLRWVFTGNGGYLEVGGGFGDVTELGVRQTLLFALANIAILTFAVRAWRHRRDDVDLWLWVLSGGIAAASGLRFFGHYYLQILPPLCLLAARPLAPASRRVLALVAAAIAIPVLVFSLPARFGNPSQPERVARDLAAYARSHTTDGQRVLVWGHLPEVYWWSDRLPATRFATTGFVTGQSGNRPPDAAAADSATPGAWHDFEADIRAHPPALIFDLSPADIRNAKDAPPSKFPRFGDVLDRDYRAVTRIDGVRVYARRDA